jgi:hypothetical protein
MRFYLGQVYSKPWVSFPFSHELQRYLSREIGARIAPSGSFVARYGADWALTLRLGADTNLTRNKIEGPSVSKKNRDVEYALVLPFDAIVESSGDLHRAALEFALVGIAEVLRRAGLDPSRVSAASSALIDEICARPEMFLK